MRSLLAMLLSLGLGLFLADGVVSLLDDSLILFFDLHVLTGIRGILFLFALLMTILIYGLIGLTPAIPKRLFVPVTLFSPVAGLGVIPFLIYSHQRIQHVAWVISLGQVIFGLSILYCLQGGFKFRWPIVAESRLGDRTFSWRNLLGFVLVNVLVLVPLVLAYLGVCASLAVSHFSEGFVALRPNGLSVQARKYIRNDGRTIQLFPMSHIGESDFYATLSRSFATNSIVLTEGVSDNRNLLTNKISYQRMATTLGLAEQQNEFKPGRSRMARADVDVEEFAPSTIDFLNLAMLIHARGANADSMLKLMQYPPQFQEQLFNDVLRRRNRRLLQEIHSQLAQSNNIIVPWGAAHMPEIAREIQRAGFRLSEARDHTAIRFRFGGSQPGRDMQRRNQAGPE